MSTAKTFSLLDPALVKPAIASAFGKLDPRVQWRNPVMFVVYIGSIITTILWGQALVGQGDGGSRNMAADGDASGGSKKINTDGVVDHTHSVSGSIGPDGGGAAPTHNNMQPSIVLNYIIKY